MSKLRLCNDAQAQAEDWWDWAVWLDGPASELAEVEAVTYRLHPTFPDPIRTVRDATTNFKLHATGWGEFSIKADVQFRNGRQLKLEHLLSLDGLRRSPVAAKPKLCVAIGVADADLEPMLLEALRERGIDAWTPELATSSTDGEGDYDRALRGAESVLAVLSEPPSPSVLDDIHAALRLGKPVILAALDNLRLPHELQNFQTIRIDARHDIATLAIKAEAALATAHALVAEPVPLLKEGWTPPPPPDEGAVRVALDPGVVTNHRIGMLPCPTNPPPPRGWEYWPLHAFVPPDAARLATKVLQSHTDYPMGSFVQQHISGSLVGARVEWHDTQGATGTRGCFRGVNLMRPVQR